MFGEVSNFETIDSIFEVIDGDRGKNYPKSDDFLTNGYCLFLNTKNVTKNGFDFLKIQFITEDKDHLLRQGKLQRGDIILTTRGTIGNVAYYGDEIQYKHIRINSGMVILRNKKYTFNPRYILYVLQEQNLYAREISGSAQPQLPIARLKKISCPLPPLALQNEFADFVKEVDKSQFVGQQSINLWRKLQKFSIIDIYCM